MPFICTLHLVRTLSGEGKSEHTIAAILRSQFGSGGDLPEDECYNGKDKLLSRISASLKRIGQKKYTGSNQYKGTAMLLQ